MAAAAVGLSDSRHPLSLWPPYVDAWLVPAQSIYMLSASSQSRLNNFFFFSSSGNNAEFLSRPVWLPMSLCVFLRLRVFV